MESWAKQKIESYNGKHSVGRSKDDGEQMRMKEGFYYYRRKLYYGTYDRGPDCRAAVMSGLRS